MLGPIIYEYKPEYIVDKYNPLTLQHTLLEKASHLEVSLREELTDLVCCVARSCKLINYHLRQAGLNNLYGDVENHHENASGETQKKIDVISNDIMKQQLLSLKSVSLSKQGCGGSLRRRRPDSTGT